MATLPVIPDPMNCEISPNSFYLFSSDSLIQLHRDICDALSSSRDLTKINSDNFELEGCEKAARLWMKWRMYSAVFRPLPKFWKKSMDECCSPILQNIEQRLGVSFL
jgi:hypothetical protein